METPEGNSHLHRIYNEEYARIKSLAFNKKSARDVPKPKLESATDKEYFQECSVLPKQCLVKEMIPDPEEIAGLIEDTYREGTIFSLVVLPFNASGYSKDDLTEQEWNAFIKNQNYVYGISVDPADNLTFGLTGQHGGYFYDLFSDIIKKDVSEGGCSFKIHYPKLAGHPDNKLWFVENYKKAFNNLKNFLDRSKLN